MLDLIQLDLTQAINNEMLDFGLCVHKNACMNQADAIEKILGCIDSDFVKALAEPARIEILKWLIVNDSCDVKTLAEKMPQDRSVISRHLALMEKAGLLQVKKEGRHMVYRVNGEQTLQKSEQLVDVVKQCLKYNCC